jgi:hypothetical protein
MAGVTQLVNREAKVEALGSVTASSSTLLCFLCICWDGFCPVADTKSSTKSGDNIISESDIF